MGPLYYRGRLVALARPLYYRGGSALVEHPFDRSEESIHEKLEIGAKEMNIGTDVQWAFWDGIRVNNEAMSNAWVM